MVLSSAQTIAIAVSVLSALVAVCATVSGIWFNWKNFSREVLNQRINLVSMRLRYFEDLQEWARQVVDLITEAIHLCDLDPNRLEGESLFMRRHRLRVELSAMIDQGRWFFPNIVVDEHGADKELGYRGYRHEVLDGPVNAYRCLGKLDYRDVSRNQRLRDDLTYCKRHFVGQIQKILDPRSRRQEFESVLQGADLKRHKNTDRTQ